MKKYLDTFDHIKINKKGIFIHREVCSPYYGGVGTLVEWKSFFKNPILSIKNIWYVLTKTCNTYGK